MRAPVLALLGTILATAIGSAYVEANACSEAAANAAVRQNGPRQVVEIAPVEAQGLDLQILVEETVESESSKRLKHSLVTIDFHLGCAPQRTFQGRTGETTAPCTRDLTAHAARAPPARHA